LVVADPTGGLTSRSAEIVARLIREAAAAPSSVIVTTPDADFAGVVADHAFTLDGETIKVVHASVASATGPDAPGLSPYVWWRLFVEDALTSLTQLRVYAGATLLAGLSMAFMVQGKGDLAVHREHYADLLHERVQAQLRPPGVVTGRAVEPGLRVLRAPNSSVILVRGHTSSFPAAWDFGPAGVEAQPPYPNRGTGNHGGVLLDLEGVVLVFGGLVSLVLGLGRVLMDRDSGGDRAVRALPLPGAMIAASRVVSGGLVVVVLVVVWFGVIAAFAGVFAANVAENLRVTLAYLSLPMLRRMASEIIGERLDGPSRGLPCRRPSHSALPIAQVSRIHAALVARVATDGSDATCCTTSDG
jgi:hypothetical protein